MFHTVTVNVSLCVGASGAHVLCCCLLIVKNKVSFLPHIQPEGWDSGTRGSGSVFILLVQECAEGKEEKERRGSV